MATNSWKQNKDRQDTTSTGDEVRGQDSYNPSIPVVNMSPTKTLPVTKLLGDNRDPNTVA